MLLWFEEEDEAAAVVDEEDELVDAPPASPDAIASLAWCERRPFLASASAGIPKEKARHNRRTRVFT